MSTRNLVLVPLVPGNDYAIDHYIYGLDPTTNEIVTDAYLGFKLTKYDNVVIPGIAQKHITTDGVDGVGIIIDAGSLSTPTGLYAAHVHFDVTQAESSTLLANYVQPDGTVGYAYYIDVLTSHGGLYTAEIGALPTWAGGQKG